HLFGDRVVTRTIGDGAEVLAERGGHAGVARAREEHVLGLPVDRRELAKEIPDVGADAEVMELSRVYADPHVCILVSPDDGRWTINGQIPANPCDAGGGFL